MLQNHLQYDMRFSNCIHSLFSPYKQEAVPWKYQIEYNTLKKTVLFPLKQIASSDINCLWTTVVDLGQVYL